MNFTSGQSTAAASDASRASGLTRPIASLHYELLTLGDELLLGLTANSHLTFIGAQLGQRGVLLKRNITITDEAGAIAEQFRESWARADVVITTGGLGPTCDDRTREAVAEVLGQKLVFDPAIEEAIMKRFVRLGRTMTENNLKQAWRFADGEVLPNPNGTAPGLWFEHIERDAPGKEIRRRVLVMLPGPPNELHPMFIEQVLPRLAQRNLVTTSEVYVQIRSIGIGESALETKLQPLFAPHGDALSVAYCAHFGQVDCRLSSPSGALSLAQLDSIAKECAVSLGEDFLCFGHDTPAKIVAELLREQGHLLAVAETVTGGHLSAAFMDMCGKSKFFAGGCLCCSYESKMQLLDVPEELLMQHGAASDEGAVAMAVGATERLGADYGIAITGFGGPCNPATDETAGNVFIGLCTPHGIWSKKQHYPGGPDVVRERAVMMAVDWLRRELLHSRRDTSIPLRAKGDGVIE